MLIIRVCALKLCNKAVDEAENMHKGLVTLIMDDL
jgi:hypothetical protein